MNPKIPSWKDPGWRENMIYPGRHWLFYDNQGNYRARVDLNPWENGLYRWRTLNWNISREDVTGLEDSLEAAQQAANQVMAGVSFQLKLAI